MKLLQRIYALPVFDPMRDKFDEWVNSRMTRTGDQILLNNKSIYVIPSRYGFMMGAMLFILLLSAMNYSNSMAFMLTFLVTSIALLGMHYTYGNMANITLSPGKAKPVFAGEQAQIPLHVVNSSQRMRYSLFLGNPDESQPANHVEKDHGTLYYLTKPLSRGRYQQGRLRIWTTFPYGLFFVWSWLKLDASVLVYPQPRQLVKDIAAGGFSHGDKVSPRSGDDDFSGIRRYQVTDSPNRIAWKALAHSQQLLSKEFNATTDDETWLDYEQLTQLTPEERLSQLCYWVLECERTHQPYGLRLPGQLTEVDLGERHRKMCLELLALFETGVKHA